MAQLRKLNQDELPIERYTGKYYSLVRKSDTVDPELLYQWIVAGPSAGDRQALTRWAADNECEGNLSGLKLRRSTCAAKRKRMQPQLPL